MVVRFLSRGSAGRDDAGRGLLTSWASAEVVSTERNAMLRGNGIIIADVASFDAWKEVNDLQALLYTRLPPMLPLVHNSHASRP